MIIDIDHILFWMDAIRNSHDQSRTLESFWKGQVKSKIWLIDNLVTWVPSYPSNVVIHGGWNGVLASLLFQTNIPIARIVSIDIDPSCEPIAIMMNKKEEMAGRFRAITGDMCNIISFVNIVINTSCEHITQEQYETWLSKRNDDQILVLQSNNYEIDEHIRPAFSLDEFAEQCKINILWKGELELPLYTRYMIIGKK